MTIRKYITNDWRQFRQLKLSSFSKSGEATMEHRRMDIRRPQSMAGILMGTLAACSIFLFSGFTPLRAATMDFALVGDAPYNAKQRDEFVNLMKNVDAQDLAFVVHVGDIWFDGIAWKDTSKGLPPCSNEVFDDRMKLMQASKHPYILSPGDNDWTDCYRAKPIKYDPLERLTKLRKMYFTGDSSLGQNKMKLIRQSETPKYAKFPENARWTYAGVEFVTLHMVGSNNNYGRTEKMDAEFEERNTANLAWLDEAFKEAEHNNSKAIMILAQANPFFENTWSPKLQKRYMLDGLGIKPPNEKRSTGFSDFLESLEKHTLAFGKPVVYVHGDTHTFLIDKPLVRTPNGSRFIENFTRVETFGFPNTHWIKVTIDTDDPNVFTFRPQIVKANSVNK